MDGFARKTQHQVTCKILQLKTVVVAAALAEPVIEVTVMADYWA